MQQRNLGRSGLIVSAVGLGCNNFGGRIDMAATRGVMHQALDLGITFFDYADIYGGPAQRRRCSATCSGRAARTSCWRLSSPGRWMPTAGWKADRAAIS